jgi:hypothetical protein
MNNGISLMAANKVYVWNKFYFSGRQLLQHFVFDGKSRQMVALLCGWL